ncbi:MAG: GGDEF domain-containing protein [Acidimicrobiia bacterium]|nr:GGDEF domain-containing protein [Acidimicrobiia bacterium]
MTALGERLDEAVRLRQIIETQRVINAAILDPDEVMRVVAERAQLLTCASAGVVELLEGDEMVYRAASGSAAASVGTRLTAATSLSGLCVRTGDAMQCEDTDLDPRVDQEACRRIGVRSMIVAPLIHRGEAVGVLKVLSAEPAAFNADDMDTLELLAGFIATSLINAAAHAEETERALHDSLTGLPNRVLLLDRLDHVLRAAKRHPSPVAVFFLDLDGFKGVNDNHGHAVGDGLLCLVAAYLRAAMRTSDTVARYGGDEFVIVCENSSPRAEPEIRARIDGAVARAASAVGAESVVTASVGVAWSSDGQTTPSALLEKADASMYETKRTRSSRA